MHATLRACFKRIKVTPDYPVSLLGYHSKRISNGVLDDLHTRIAAFFLENTRFLMIQVDTCMLPTPDTLTLVKRIADTGRFPEDNIMVFASHTHQAPALKDFAHTQKEEKYLDFLLSTILNNIPVENEAEPVFLYCSKTRSKGLAFNRRWYLKSGRVATNPPRMYPDMLRPEGPVDEEVIVISFEDDTGRVKAIFSNISNHTDTVGGFRISADWPGVMERELRERVSAELISFPLIGPQGNINHIDFTKKLDQTNYNEAIRIGKAYAECICGSLCKKERQQPESIMVKRVVRDLPSRQITAGELKAAKDILAAPYTEEPGRVFSSEDIIKGEPGALRVFAEQCLCFNATKENTYKVVLQVLGLGRIRICTIPGEPFVEMGLELKKAAKSICIPVALANGHNGYIPLKECFFRGGYETLPGSGLLHKGAFDDILKELKVMLAAC